MIFRRVSSVAGLLMLALSLSVSALAQEKPPAQDQQRKLSGDERKDYIALSDFVDQVAAGKQPVPADLKLTFQSHYLKSNENVYLPYVVEVSGGKFTSFPVAMYVRVAQKGAPAPAGKGID